MFKQKQEAHRESFETPTVKPNESKDKQNSTMNRSASAGNILLRSNRKIEFFGVHE